MLAIAMSTAPARSSEPVPVDAAILARCRAQDPMAFRAFVVRHERMVFALLSRMLGRGADIEDLAQETFVRAYRAFPAFDPNGAAKPSTWLLTIATRLALDRKRQPALERSEHGCAVARLRADDAREHQKCRREQHPEGRAHPKL